jgi:beta-phosphoglucomutase
MRKTLLCDLDGTLLHSDPLHIAVFIDLFAELGQKMDEADYLKRIHGRHNHDIFGDLFPDQDAHALSIEKEARFRDRLGKSVPEMPGVTALLDLAETRDWQVGVVTNAPRQNAEAMLQAIGIRNRFSTLIIGEECSAGKPHPAPYQAAMQELGVTPNYCTAFEDSPSGLRSARSSGALTIGVRSSLSDFDLRNAGAHASIQDYNDPMLPELLARQQGDAPV